MFELEDNGIYENYPHGNKDYECVDCLKMQYTDDVRQCKYCEDLVCDVCYFEHSCFK